VAIETALRLCRELDGERVFLQGRRVIVIPVLNPDGRVRGTRKNARQVDLNRNFPTRNWGADSLRAGDTPGAYAASEPETRALLGVMKRERPAKVLALHAPARMNNYDGPAGRPMALAMSSFNKYPVMDDIGYPTPGSFGTWAGRERGIPTVTLEIPEGTGAERWEENRWALLAAIRLDLGLAVSGADGSSAGIDPEETPGR
jgi:protein MpaA